MANTTNNFWEPYDATCATSSYMKALYRGEQDRGPLIPVRGVQSTTTREYLPWLMNRTIILQGDSIERYHVKDFCDLVKGRLFLVDNEHPAIPAPYRQSPPDDGTASPAELQEMMAKQRQKEAVWEARDLGGGQAGMNPWVCDIEEYGATIVFVTSFGLEVGPERLYSTEAWYHPPETWVDRFTFIMLPLLKNLAVHLGRPQIERPDLVEICSGFWDLRRFTEEDFIAKGYPNRPYPDSPEIPFQNISPEREMQWEMSARKMIKSVARSFPGSDGTIRSGPPILWRSFHHILRHNPIPYNRVFALDSLARKVIEDLQNESLIHSSLRRQPTSSIIQQEELIPGEDLGLDDRLRIDEWGAIMMGQEHHFIDDVHPAPVPGSYIWGDVILWELQQAVLRQGKNA